MTSENEDTKNSRTPSLKNDTVSAGFSQLLTQRNYSSLVDFSFSETWISIDARRFSQTFGAKNRSQASRDSAAFGYLRKSLRSLAMFGCLIIFANGSGASMRGGQQSSPSISPYVLR